MANTIKQALKDFTGRDISCEDFTNRIPEVIKIGLTFTNGEKKEFVVNEYFLDNYFNEENGFSILIYEDSIQYYISFGSTLVERENLASGEIDDLTIESVTCYNKGSVSIKELIEYYNGGLTTGSDVFTDTNDFQLKFGLKQGKGKPGFLTDKQMTMKIGHLKEELAEIEKAYQERDIVEVADGLMDLIYVAAGLANLMNLPCNTLWNDVQNSNMAYKERVTSLDNATKRGSTFDVRKTKDWIAPRGKEIIEEATKHYIL